ASSRLPCASLRKAQRELRRGRCRFDIAAGDDRAGGGKRLDLAGPVLRIAVGTADVADRYELAPVLRCRALRAPKRVGQVVGGTRMRPVTDDEVEEQDGKGKVFGRFANRRVA